MKNYYTVIICQKALRATEKYKETDWVSWCWEYVGINNFSWTIDPDIHDTRENYKYIIYFRYEEDKVLFILNWA